MDFNTLWQSILAGLGAAWIWIMGIFMQMGLVPNNLVVEPTVFVGENEYQIVWETRQPSAAWVVVDGVTYADSLAGNLVLDKTAHKVRVPMEALDAAGGYEINWQHALRSMNNVAKGSHKAKSYNFRAPDFSDGIQIYNLADTHSNLQPGAQTAKYWGDKLDLLILNGDIIQDPQIPAARNFALRLAFEITGGERPVLYTRGNHETRGAQANDLDRYLGTPSADRWYFTTRLGPLWIAVFDAGEDKLDDHVEYQGLAYYAEYREKQTRFFENVIANAAGEFAAEDVEYRLLVSHIPVGRSSAYGEVQAQWAELANQMDIDLALSGHNHSTVYHPPNTFNAVGVTLNYPLIIGSRPAHGNAEGIFTAAAVELKDGGIQAWFTNQHHSVLQTITVR